MVHALLGKKMGMTQHFTPEGLAIPVTALQIGPCNILQIKHSETDGYHAIQLGFDEKKAKHTNRPEMGRFKSANTTPKRLLREVKATPTSDQSPKVGLEVKVSDVFKSGDIVDVKGISKGRGFSGVFRRHNFHGPSSMTHGTHEYKRHGGSIGQCATPSKTFKNIKMPGQHGNSMCTIQNLEIVQILEDQNIALIKGAVPGPKQGYVQIQHAVKAKK